MRLRLLLALGCLAAPTALPAQRRAPAGIIAASRPAPRPHPWAAPAGRRPRAWPYVVGGAAVGALATAGGIWLVLTQSDSECLCAAPLAFAPVVAGGAALGAGGGYLVYRVRF